MRKLSWYTLIFVVLSPALILPVIAQNAVPPTARQAASLPEYASRLAHPAAGHMLVTPRSRSLQSMPDTLFLYDNGGVNGTTDAWTINFGFAVTDSVVANGVAASIDFNAWLFPGDTLMSVEVDVGSQPFGTDLFRGTVNVVQSNCVGNQFGYNVCLETGNFNGPGLEGTAWFTLQNASVNTGDPVYWDENSGVGCQSTGCPSQAEFNSIGSIPSESFDVGGNQPACGLGNFSWKRIGKAMAQSFQVIYNFLGGPDGSAPLGLTIDRAGNFYGTTVSGGNTTGDCSAFGGCGTVYRLAQQSSGWAHQTLYRFSGDDGEGPSSRVTIGHDGSLYGVTWLGGGGFGAVYNLRPPAHACPNATCTWQGTVLHSFGGFSSDSRVSPACSSQPSAGAPMHRSASPNNVADGSEPSGDLVFDSAGNVYGTAPWGGSGPGNCGCGFPCGIIYELTPSHGTWSENILYNFQGEQDGGTPSSGVIFDSAGNLYGTASAQPGGGGTIFRLNFGGGLDVLHDFTYLGRYGASPLGGLLRDQNNNLFGTTARGGVGCGGCGCGTVFEMPGAGNFTSLYAFNYNGPTNLDPGPQSALVADAAGNLYGSTVQEGAYGYGTVFELTPTLGGWIYTDLYDFTGGNDGYAPSGLTMDAGGNLWGTASGGTFGNGVIFEITP